MTWTSVNPMNDAVLATMDETTPQELEDALAAAWAAAPVLRAMSAADRGRWIRAVADALDRRSDELVRLARSETGLPDARLTGEVIRTTTQLRFLAEHAETGQPFEPTIDRSDRSWVPAPRPDLRSVRTGIGVVLVFAASNFPFAFSVAAWRHRQRVGGGLPGHRQDPSRAPTAVRSGCRNHQGRAGHAARAAGCLRRRPRLRRRRCRAQRLPSIGGRIHRLGRRMATPWPTSPPDARTPSRSSRRWGASTR